MAGSGKREVPAASCPTRFQLARDLGILLARAVLHHEEHVASQQPYMDMRCPAKKYIIFLLKKWQEHGVNNLCNVASTV